MLSFLYNYPEAGVIALRIAIGAIFIAHGTKKLPGKMGGFMTFIGVCETLGGIAVLLGFMTQWAALGLALIMVGAIYKKIFEWKMPFSSSEKLGWEVDLLIIAGCITLITFGGGPFSADTYWNLMI